MQRMDFGGNGSGCGVSPHPSTGSYETGEATDIGIRRGASGDNMEEATQILLWHAAMSIVPWSMSPQSGQTGELATPMLVSRVAAILPIMPLMGIIGAAWAVVPTAKARTRTTERMRRRTCMMSPT
jgi:hypothetical protein